VGLLLLACLPARAELLPLRGYTVADGLAHNSVNKIVRDSRGFLWFCTAEGLSRFDGYSFTNYGTNEGLPHAVVNDFLETRGGEIWLATNGGLVSFDPKGRPSRIEDARSASPNPQPLSRDSQSGAPMFTVVVPEGADRYAKAVSVLLEGRDGMLWVGTLKGLHRLERDGGGYALRPVELGMPGESLDQRYVLDLLEDRRGSLWVATGDGLYRRRPDGSATHYTARDGLPDDYIHDLLEDRRGRLWAATRYGGFFQLAADDAHATPVVARKYSARDGLTTDWVAHLFESADGRFWAATNKGLAEFFPDAAEQEPRFKTYTQRNGLLHYGLANLGEDAGGNLWLGSEAGAMKLARDGLVSYGEGDGILGVFAVFGDRTGGVCFRAAIIGDDRRTVFEGAQAELLRPLENWHGRFGRFDGGRFTWLLPDVLDQAGMGWVGEMLTLQSRHTGEWWLGTGQGVYRFPATDDFAQLKRARPLAVYADEAGLPVGHYKGRVVLQVFRLFEDSRGDMWVSAIAPLGLARWERAADRWHDLRNAPGVPTTGDEIAQSFGEDRNGNVWVGFSTGAARYRGGRFDFFGAGEGLPPGRIQHVYSDAAGRLWLASSRSGLVRVDDPGAERPAFRAYTTAEGLSSDSAEVVTEDSAGRIYVGTGRALDRLDPATGHVEHFTTAEGLAPGAIRAAFRAADGALWFGTSKGLSRYAPARGARAAPPPILITGLQVAGAAQTVSALGETEVALPELSSDQNQLRIDFVGLSFAPGEVLRYQYKLEGSDADWGPPVEQRTVNYASLAPGRYRFNVRAVTSDGEASAQPASVSFTIPRPVWQRWWFLALAALALALAAYAAYRYRVARLLEVAEMRTRIATDLHDDIGANLTKIAILSEVVKQRQGNGGTAGVGHQLSSIARISRESVAAMSDIVWAINPERDSLRDLVRRMRQHAEEVFTARDIELSFDAPPAGRNLRLGADVRRDLLLIFKEAVNNAARHSGCARVGIDFETGGARLTLRVADDGAGFDTAAESDGQGLGSMRRRAERLGGTFEVESGEGSGTTITVRIPIAHAHHL
jgi:ligand-binding sensor domain-containing protein/signal transduction histidine kinase